MVQCTDVHSRWSSTSPSRDSRYHRSSARHTLPSPSEREDKAPAFLKRQRNLRWDQTAITAATTTITAKHKSKFQPHWETKPQAEAPTESWWDTNISALNTATFVVSWTVVVAHAALVQRDNLDDTRAVARFRTSHWKQKEPMGKAGNKVSMSESWRRASKFQLRGCWGGGDVPLEAASAWALATVSKCTNAPRVRMSAHAAPQCFSMLTSLTQECSTVWTHIPVHNLEVGHSRNAGSLCQ